MGVRPGFLFATEGEWIARLGSGVAAWEALPLAGYSFTDPAPASWRGANVIVDGRGFAWGFERGYGDGWRPAEADAPAMGRRCDWEFPPGRLLRPATLPPMLDRELQIGAVRLVADTPSAETRALPVRQADHRAGEAAAWADLLHGRAPIALPPHTTRRVLVDLEQYYCAYPELVLSGGAGAQVRLLWAEALFHDLDPLGGNKGPRDEVE